MSKRDRTAKRRNTRQRGDFAAHGPETMEFRREFDAHTDTILRRRLLWFIGVWGGLNILTTAILFGTIAYSFFRQGEVDEAAITRLHAPITVPVYSAVIGAYIASFFVALKGRLSNQQAVWLSIGLVVIDGLSGIALRAGGMDGLTGLFAFFISHVVASLVFPWSARQAALPAVIILTINALSLLFLEKGLSTLPATVTAIAFTPLLAMPGCLIAWARHSRRLGQYRYTFVQKRYGSLKQELAYARSVHESMFPTPRTGKNVNFTFKYEPMRQIGGDYLFASHCPTEDGDDEALSVVLLDVTGHGIPAALTVNRLHGEIELLFADDPFIGPGEVLRRLNRYVHLTLARHSIYVTAVCMKACPHTNTLAYASGGHPPAFLRGVDGTLADLESTSFVLGACADADFDPGEKSVRFGPGDSVISYTDGATEARRESGQMLRISGMRALLAAHNRVEPGAWPAHLLNAVKHHRDGLPPEDDTLFVEIFRDLRDTRTHGKKKVSPADRARTDREAQPAGHHSPVS